MSGIPVAYEVNIDDLRDPEFVDIEFINESLPINGERFPETLEKHINYQKQLK